MKRWFKKQTWRGVLIAERHLRRTAAWQDLLTMQGRQAAWEVGKLERLGQLSDAEFKVFSQGGEDGILEWLVSHLPAIPQSFVEFGVEDYLESNTRFLLCQRNWRGLVMDASPAHIESLRSHEAYWKHDLKVVAAFIDTESVNPLISGHGFRGELGVLSIDVDGNDYWIWNAIDVVNPWIVVVEYNAVLGDLHPFTIPYDAAFSRARAHYSWLYFGASIRALECLGKTRGYTLLGSNLGGWNAFFLRNDVGRRIQEAIADKSPRPSLFRDSRGRDGRMSYAGGIDRLALIAEMPVLDLTSGRLLRLEDAGEVYSDRWKAIMGESGCVTARN